MSKVLGNIAKLQGGYAYKSRDLGDVGLPVVKIGDVTGGGSISYGAMQKIPVAIASETERFATIAGDTLISMKRDWRLIKGTSIMVTTLGNKQLIILDAINQPMLPIEAA